MLHATPRAQIMVRAMQEVHRVRLATRGTALVLERGAHLAGQSELFASRTWAVNRFEGAKSAKKVVGLAVRL